MEDLSRSIASACWKCLAKSKAVLKRKEQMWWLQSTSTGQSSIISTERLTTGKHRRINKLIRLKMRATSDWLQRGLCWKHAFENRAPAEESQKHTNRCKAIQTNAQQSIEMQKCICDCSFTFLYIVIVFYVCIGVYLWIVLCAFVNVIYLWI